MGATEEVSVVGELMVDPRLERLLTIAKEINDFLAKISAATSYLSDTDGADDLEEVEVARAQLSRDLARCFAEAKELLPAVDETVSKLEDRAIHLESARKMSIGLAKIEGLSGTGKQEKFLDNAKSLEAKVSEVENLIGALGALKADLSSSRKTPRSCPRCMKADLSYRLTPSELGFTVYKCERCGNAWRITSFTMRSS